MAAPRAPERTCVGCRGRSSKSDLLRIVLDRSGGVVADPSGSAPGRGAYVHRYPVCMQAAVRGGGLARALRADVGGIELGRLMEPIEGGT